MTIKEAMIGAARGEPLPFLPFVPRMDIWYNANSYRQTLPSKYEGASLRDILDDLELGYHYMIPDFCDLDGTGEHDEHHSLGIYTFKTCPYRVRLHNIDHETRYSRGSALTTYHTPYGDITIESVLDESVKASGATAPFVRKYPVQGIEDLRAVAYIYENAEVNPYYDGYNAMVDYVGDRGVVVAFHSFGASPVHFILRVLMGLENFYYTLFDYRDELLELAETVEKFYDATFRAAVESPAEIVMSGTNFNTIVTPPYFFEEFIVEEMKKRSDYCEQRGKLLAAHPDGENTGLLQLYKKSCMHIADSICPAPMTGLSLASIRKGMGDDIAIYGGLPSICVLPDSMTDYEFQHTLDETLGSIGSGRHIVLSVSDTTPPDASLERIMRIKREAEQFKLCE